MRVGWVAAACAFAFAPLAAQDSTRTAQDSAVRVFLDCPNSFCDFDYYRTEITFVNWVRDRADAQVHVLITTQTTSGGQEFTLAFIGLERYAHTADTLRWNSKASDTEDDIRRGLAGVLRLGLVRFAAHTPLAHSLEITYNAPTAAVASEIRDPWNHWVFSVGLSGNLNGQKSLKFQYWNGNFSADRRTDKWKTTFSVNDNYNQSDFTVPVLDSTGAQIGEDKVRNITRGNDASALVVRSVGAHWSLGARATGSSSTFFNQKLALHFAPGIEYDVIPYSQSTRRLLTFRYEIGPTLYRYRDTTIFNRVRETRFVQSLNTSLDVKQPWGSAGVSMEASNYLYDFRKNRLTFFGNGNFRVFKGLSLQLLGSISLIHDQLSIPKAGASEQEVLLQRRQLATSYQYFGFLQLSYTFGSKFANIVNPRFGNQGGGGMIMIM
jgi:hypothetical protein